MKMCPLKAGVTLNQCRGGGCAWWDEHQEACAVLVLAQRVRSLAMRVDAVAEDGAVPVVIGRRARVGRRVMDVQNQKGETDV